MIDFLVINNWLEIMSAVLTIVLQPECDVRAFEFDPDATVDDVKVAACLYWGKRPEDMHMWIPIFIDVTMASISMAMSMGYDICLEPLTRFIWHESKSLLDYIRSDNYDGCVNVLTRCKDYLPHIFEVDDRLTPSVAATIYGRFDILKLFVTHYPSSINFENDEGYTPLLYAMSSVLQHVDAVIALGADVNFRNGKPLEYAVRAGRYEVMRHLIDAGAGIFIGEQRLVMDFTCAGDKCNIYLAVCVARRQIVHRLFSDRTSYFGLLPRDLWEYYLDPLLYNALKVLKN